MAKSLYRFPELIDDQNFNDTETDSIMSTFFKKEPPLHMMFRASVRLNAKLIEKCAVALSPHYANFFQQKNKGKVFNIFLSIFVFSHQNIFDTIF